MSEVPQAPAAAAPPAPVVESAPAPPAPAPAPTPAPAAPPVAPAAAPGGQFVQVDRGRLDPWDGDFHRTISDANAYQNTMGKLIATYGAEQAQAMMAELLRIDQASAVGPQAGGYQPPQPPVQPAFTEEAARTMFGEMIQNQLMPALKQQTQSVLGEHSTGLQQDWQYKQDMAAALQSRTGAIGKVVEGVGFGAGNETLKTKDGSEHFLTRAVRRAAEDALYDAMVNGAPEELLRRLGKEEEDGITEGPVRKEWDQYMASPTDEHLAAANKGAEAFRDLQFTLTAKTAAEQGQIPTSPGAGPAAGAEPKSPDEMSAEEHAAAAAKHEAGAPGDDDGSDWSRDH